MSPLDSYLTPDVCITTIAKALVETARDMSEALTVMGRTPDNLQHIADSVDPRNAR